MNLGRIIKTRSGKMAYIKKVDWSSAVLWKDREISLNPKAVGEMIPQVELIIFIDESKNKCWSITKDRVKQIWKLKKEGQEEQWYFSIDELEEKDIKKPDDFYETVYKPALDAENTQDKLL